MRQPTAKDLQTVDAVRTLTRALGTPPTVREMCRALDLTTQAVHERVRRCQRKGLLVVPPIKGKARQIVPTEPEQDQGLAAVSVVDMGDGTVAVHARVAVEDAGSLCSRIRAVAAAAAKRGAA